MLFPEVLYLFIMSGGDDVASQRFRTQKHALVFQIPRPRWSAEPCALA